MTRPSFSALAKANESAPGPKIESVRPILRTDLARLAKPRDKSLSSPKRMRDSHHNVARFASLGYSHAQISAITGYTSTRVGQLLAAPAMQELVARYRGKVDEAFDKAIDVYAEYAVRNMIAAERQLTDRLDEADAEGETLPVRELVAITSDRADRFGYPKRAVNTNVNVDFADRLERAIKRSGTKTIEATPQSVQGSNHAEPTLAPARPSLRRIA